MTYNITYSNELYHHGIKGMRWGVRRFQKKDGSLTPAGKKRYDDDGPSTTKSEKITHRQKLEQKYVSKGMSPKQAAMAADRRIKIEKVVAVTAGVTLTAAAVYATNKIVRSRTDQIIKSGKTLQRIEMQDTGGKLYDTFYASKGRHDNKRYEGLLGLTRHQQAGHAYKMTLEATGDIKVASKKKATKVFEDLYKNDPEFKKSVENYVSAHILKGGNRADPNDMSPKNIKKMYDNFNSALIGMRGTGADTKFYSKLKSEGYGAIQDINDMKFSGYKAKNPLILFGVKDKISTKSFREIEASEAAKKGFIELGKMSAGEMVKIVTPVVGVKMATTTANNTKMINEYRREHPNTNLTDKEILERVY